MWFGAVANRSRPIPFGIGLSNIDISAANQLAKTGSQAATTLGSTIRRDRDNLDFFIEGQYMLAGLEPQKYSTPDSDLLASIGKVQDALTARAQLMSQLSDVYTSFGDLAAFDTGQFNTAVKNLDDGINSYASAMKKTAPISPVESAAASDIAGLIGSEVQKRKLKTASEKIRARLGPIAKLMTDEESLLIGLQKTIAQGTRDVALAFLKHGFASPDPILSSQVSSVGLTYVSGSYDHACSDVPVAKRSDCRSGIRESLSQIVTKRSSRQADLQSELYASSVKALNALDNAHQEFEHGAPLSLAAISSDINEVQTIADDLNAAEEKPAPKSTKK